MIYSARTLHQIYPKLLEELIDYGKDASPRDKGIKELCGVSIMLNTIEDPLPLWLSRKLNYRWACFEGLANILGVYPKELVLKFNKNMESFMNKETDQWDGAYPPRVFKGLEFVIKTLKHDKWSRRAVIPIYGEQDLHDSLDIACTENLQFLIRDNKLNLIATMRSNDVYLGIAYDVNQFVMIQKMVASELGLECGWYHHFAGSFHLYDSNLDKAMEIINESKVEKATMQIKEFKHTDWKGTTLPVARHYIECMFEELKKDVPKESINLAPAFDYYYKIMTKQIII